MRPAQKFLASAFCLLLSVGTLAAVKTAAFRVEGMTTDAAAKRVAAAVKTVPGVQDAVGSPGEAILMVRYDNAKANAFDLAEAVNGVGYTLSPVEWSPSKDPAGTKGASAMKTKTVLTDFAAVLSQTKEFVDKDRYGVVRNLAPAMRLRRDAVMAFEKTSGSANAQQLAQSFSREVDRFAAAADARDKAAVQADWGALNKAFKALAEANNFDDVVAPPVVPADQQTKKSIEDQLKDYITKVLGNK